MLLTVIAILLESSGKVYYISKRVGANYKIFDFYKFRSMYPNADTRVKDFAHLNQYIGESVEEVCSECAKLPSNQTCSPLVYYDGEQICERLANKRHNAKKAFLKIKNDPRITKVGKFIRMSSIDELPQLFNIIKGDMSIVGNRPLPLNEAEALTKKKWSRRFRAAAGLTGLWQVEKRGRKGTMSEEERFALDNYYAEHNSFWGDFKIILRTVTVFIQKENV
ncbi:MAG: sugar transferase [Bacteroidales bacterium]|nr:sugar transferase [Bacteroidales bacterium]